MKEKLFGNYDFEQDWICYMTLYANKPDMMTGLYELGEVSDESKKIIIDIMNERAERYRDHYESEKMSADKFRFAWRPSDYIIEVFEGETSVLTLPFGSNFLVNDLHDMSTPVYLDDYEIHDISIYSVSLYDKDNPLIMFAGKLFRDKDDKWVSRNDLRLMATLSK